MANLGAVMSKHRSSPAISTRPLSKLARNWDALLVLLLIVASLPLAWLSPKTVVVIQHPGTFDDHWVLDAVYKVTHGIYFARDVVFLYGPLAHWLMAAPPRLAGLSLGSIYTSYRTLLLWCAVVFTYGALRLLLPEQPAWKRAVLLLVMCAFWTSWDGRTALGLLLFAGFLRGWYAVREGTLMPVPFACGSALAIAFAFYYSADTGVYGIAAWSLTLAGVVWQHRRETHKLRLVINALAAFAASAIVLLFVINLANGGLLDFHFWRTSLALVSVHRWNEPVAMSDSGEVHLLVPLLAGSALFALRLLVPADRSKVIAARIGFLLSAFAFAVLSMQSGLVRSDFPHIIAGVYPIAFFSGVILFSFRSRIVSIGAAIATVAASLLFVRLLPEFQPASLRWRLARMIHPIATCPRGYREIDRACFPDEFANSLQATVTYLQQHSSERDAVLIYPYQYMFAVAARRDAAGAVEQSFLANGAYLSQFDIDGMKRANAPVGLFVRDATPREYASPTLSLPIDDVSNFTRTPDVWFWVFRNYRADQPLAPGVIGLVRDETRVARISSQVFPLSLQVHTYPVDGRSAAIELGAPEWPAGGADFLRLRMKLRYSPLWKLRKPERLQLEITRTDGSRSLRSFVLEPNVETDVWFYPWDEADLALFFDSHEETWRMSPRPAIANLRLIVSPLDWFSQEPESVTIGAADAVRFDLTQ
ncbi:MAG TPA: hypothetical protein VLW48_01115 [Candidatus Bathyarchaeia archaeon]|nr:hypothetical protein [Candidatus Bathyarchaeia archaeon]